VTRARPFLLSLGAVGLLLAVYLALGGASYEPTPVADPCAAREWREPGGVEAVLEQIALSALDGAACELGVSREELVLALEDEESLDAFSEEHGVSRADAERAVDDGFERAVADAEEAGALSGRTAALVAGVLGELPPWLLLDALERVRDLLSLP
jgi:hypothetical protein